LYDRCADKVSYEDAYWQTLLELNPEIQENVWESKFRELELNEAWQEFITAYPLKELHCNPSQWNWHTLDGEAELHTLQQNLH
jgi:hypothetical protein